MFPSFFSIFSTQLWLFHEQQMVWRGDWAPGSPTLELSYDAINKLLMPNFFYDIIKFVVTQIQKYDLQNMQLFC